MPPKDEGAGDVDARIRARDDPDQERKGKIVDGTATKEEQRHRGQEYRAGSNDGSTQRLIQRLIDEILKAAAHTEVQVFANAIEDDDFVIERETNDGQHGSNHRGIELTAFAKPAGHAITADGQ